MALFMQQSVSSTREWSPKQMMVARTILVTSTIISMLSLSACQSVPVSAPTTSPTTAVSPTPVINEDDYVDDSYVDDAYIDNDGVDDGNADDYPVEPYIIPELPPAPKPVTEPAPVVHPSPVINTPSRNDYQIAPPTPPSHNELLERARQNSQQRSRQSAANNSNLPAFQNLMQAGISQLKSGNLTAAESSFTRAQRLAPKSTAVYFYLSQVALKKNQPRKAEAMARRGLSFSNDSGRRRSLWQLILRSGQMQNNSRVVKEAQQALR